MTQPQDNEANGNGLPGPPQEHQDRSGPCGPTEPCPPQVVHPAISSHAPGFGPPGTPSRRANPPSFLAPTAAQIQRDRRRKRRRCLILFLLTFLSTTLVGSQFRPIEMLIAAMQPEEDLTRVLNFLDQVDPAADGQPLSVGARFWRYTLLGCEYSVPLMFILLCHELGHYILAVRNRVPASLPYFIPLPLPPLGTMGAVIFQQRGTADRRQMFDIAVAGPLAGLVATIPILYYGISESRYGMAPVGPSLEFGEPLLVTGLIRWLHGPEPAGQVFYLNGIGMAGWVGVFVTAMNLLPVGQLDGGHILYTLIGRHAHRVAVLVLGVGAAMMVYSGKFSYVLLLVLLLLTGTRHPPTRDDSVPISRGRQLLGWATMSFLIIGFTPVPIDVPAAEEEKSDQQPPARTAPRDRGNSGRLPELATVPSDSFVVLPAGVNAEQEASLQ